MIRVKVEMLRRGNPNDTYSLGEMFIANDGTGTKTTGNYTYRINGKNNQHMHSGRIVGFKRNAEHMWNLVKLVLNETR